MKVWSPIYIIVSDSDDHGEGGGEGDGTGFGVTDFSTKGEGDPSRFWDKIKIPNVKKTDELRVYGRLTTDRTYNGDPYYSAFKTLYVKIYVFMK